MHERTPQAAAWLWAGALSLALLATSSCATGDRDHAAPLAAADGSAAATPPSAGTSAAEGGSAGTATAPASTTSRTPASAALDAAASPAPDAMPLPNTAGSGAAAGAAAMRPQGAGPDAAADASAAVADAAAMGPWQWPTGKPEDYGLETSVLDSAAARIQSATGNRYGMVVVRKGVLIYEKCRRNQRVDCDQS